MQSAIKYAHQKATALGDTSQQRRGLRVGTERLDHMSRIVAAHSPDHR
jgi:hypothetical protein